MFVLFPQSVSILVLYSLKHFLTEMNFSTAVLKNSICLLLRFPEQALNYVLSYYYRAFFIRSINCVRGTAGTLI